MGSKYKRPDVFIEERKAALLQVANASTSTYLSCGHTQKGPDYPLPLGGFSDYLKYYGNHWRKTLLSHAVVSYFDNAGNAGGIVYVNRVVPSDATKAANATAFADVVTKAEFIGRVLPATTDLSTNKNIKVSVGGAAALTVDISAGAAVPAAVTPAEIVAAVGGITGLDAELLLGRLKVTTTATGPTASILFSLPATIDASKEVLGLDLTTSDSPLFTGEAASNWLMEAPYKGAWYNSVRMELSGNEDSLSSVTGEYATYDVSVQSLDDDSEWVEEEVFVGVNLADEDDENFISTIINDSTLYCKINHGTTYTAPRSLRSKVVKSEWLVGATVTYAGTLLNTNIVEGSFVVKAGAIIATDNGFGVLSGTGITTGSIVYDTGVYSITFGVAPTVPVIGNYYVKPSADSLTSQLAAGIDGVAPITRAEVSNPSLSASKGGIYGFGDIEGMATMSLPDFAGNITVYQDMQALATNSMRRILPMTSPKSTNPINMEKWVKTTLNMNSKYAAVYYPWIKITDPIANDGRTMLVPSDGFTAGIYARTDSTRTVAKAPAGIEDGALIGAVGLEYNLEDTDRDRLSIKLGVNCFQDTVRTGRALMGARTQYKGSEAPFVYVNVSRFFMFLEQSFYASSYWALFETLSDGLYGRLKAQGDSFLKGLHDEGGYFPDGNAADVYRVVCDRTNNTAEVIAAGEFIVDYYIAPSIPGEFLRLRFQLKQK